MKIVVYTAVIGPIDRLWSVLPGSDKDIQHIAFVDTPKTEHGLWGKKPPTIVSDAVVGKRTWEQRIVTDRWGSRRTARHYKTLPHRYMPDADVWIWIDGNVRARMYPQVVIDRWFTGDLVTFEHWERKCLYDEAAFCAKVGKDSPAILTAQAARYRKDGMPKRWGLPATRVVIRRNTADIQALNEAWWAEIEQGSLRDQVSLPYVCWKNGIRWNALPGRCHPGWNGDFLCIKHDRRVK